MTDETRTTEDVSLRGGTVPGAALDAVFPIVYDELRRLAHLQLQRERTGLTLRTTDLVHEAYLRLASQQSGRWKDRSHFLAIAAMAMRRILVDHARTHRTDKRGGGVPRVALDAVEVPIEDRAEFLLALDEALVRLQGLDARQARLVECRFFGGLTEEETADALGIGLRTAKRDWAKARSWLYAELYPGGT
jgi:RNA polymerase sigma factor (TIGR02999 family)